MTRQTSARGYALLAVTSVLAIAAVSLAAVEPAFEGDVHLERSRERLAVAERLAEIGLQTCRRSGAVPWTRVVLDGAAGRFRSEALHEQGNEACVGFGVVEGTGRWPSVSSELRGPPRK
jgi:hypothetical protein